MMGFKQGFIWGGASASYQIEGAVYEDGRGLSVWDMFCKERGRIVDGSSGDIACDHYHRYQEDVDIMKELEFGAYRFSIAWPRIIPDGGGKPNEKGLDFYDRLVDSLLEANIIPYATLFHWDYPYALYQKGGWMNPDSPKWFAEYATAVCKRIGDRVKHYFTINEPQCFIGLGFKNGEHAPGLTLPDWDTLAMMHNVLLGHGMAVRAIRGVVADAQIGFAPTCTAYYPESEREEDIEAARKAMFDIGGDWSWSVASWSDPVIFGKYPAQLTEKYGEYMPKIGADDMKIISEPIDFYGQNIYNGRAVRADGKGGYEFCERPAGYPFTAAKWPVTPECLYWGPKFLYERYKKPFYITENGLSCADVVSLDGKVHDPNRIDFLHRYLREYKRAAADGVDARGYFQWCVTDNFEWAKGYTDRFGMVFCDYVTQKRIIKDSGYWYRDIIRENGAKL